MSLPLQLKAEVVLAMQLVSRHRSVRLAALLSVLLTAALAVGESEGGKHQSMVLVVTGMLCAVAGSRIFAPGGALTAARITAAPWWVAPSGRLVGAGCVVYPLALVSIASLVAPAGGAEVAIRVCFIVGVLGIAMLGVVAALTPLVGASAGAALGFMAAWLGAIPPSAIHGLLDSARFIQRPLVALWNVLPLPWRAVRWLSQGQAGDAALLIVWGALAAVLVAWSTNRYFRVDRRWEVPT